MIFYVYEHWRPDREEPFYVGKGKGSRANRMTNRNIHHRAIQKKLHRLGMAVEVRIVSEGLTEKEAFDIEKYRIKMWKDAGIDLANKSDGGEGNAGHIGLRGNKSPFFGKPSVFKGKKHTEESKRKISEKAKKRKSRTGYKHSEETKSKISNSHKGKKCEYLIGRHLSEETKLKISNSVSRAIAGEKNPFFGKKHSEETKKSISLKKSCKNHPRFGKKDSEEVKKNKSTAAKLHWEKRRQKIGS